MLHRRQQLPWWPVLAAACALALPVSAWACGSMGLDDPRTRAFYTAAVFLPMLALIPVEMGFLKWLGRLDGRVIKAYLACLPAKLGGVIFTALAARENLVQSIWAVEAAYSIGHLLVAAPVLALGFGLRGVPLLASSVAISTVIPWLYSLGFWQILLLAESAAPTIELR